MLSYFNFGGKYELIECLWRKLRKLINNYILEIRLFVSKIFDW